MKKERIFRALITAVAFFVLCASAFSAVLSYIHSKIGYFNLKRMTDLAVALSVCGGLICYYNTYKRFVVEKKKSKFKLSLRKISSVISFLAVCFLLFIFTFYVDGEMGIILVFFTFAAPIVSIVFTFLGKDKIRVTINGECYVRKGYEITVNIKAEKIGRFPISFVEIHTEAGQVFTQKNTAYRTALNFDNHVIIKHTLTAVHGGYGEFRIKEVYLCDFLGFVRIKAGLKIYPKADMGVIPDIPEISANTGLFRMISNLVITSDEEEQESALAFTANTSPGYEHREYFEGDPLKRINWKASSKRGKLMVRLDEAVSTVQPAIIFDSYRMEGADELESIIKEERLYEAVFGLLNLFIRQGIAIKFYHSFLGNIIETNVESIDAANQLLFKILTLPITSGTVFPFEDLGIGKACTTVISVPKLSRSYIDSFEQFGDGKNSSIIVAEADGYAGSLPYQVWHLEEDNNFKLVK